MDLFLDESPKTKTAMVSSARMVSNADHWPTQLLQEAYRQLPFLAEYDVSVNIPRSVPEQGTAIGYVEVKNKTDRSPGEELLGKSVKHSRIPIVIHKFQLAPFDLFMQGEKTWPLTEARFRQHMFRAETFDGPGTPPAQKYMASDLAPPFGGGQYGGYFGGMTVTGSAHEEALAEMLGVEKAAGVVDSFLAKKFDEDQLKKLEEASGESWDSTLEAKKKLHEKKAGVPLLRALAPSMDAATVEKVAAAIADDPALRRAFRSSETAAEMLGYIAGASTLDKVAAADMWSQFATGIKPTVVQLTKTASGTVMAKWANPEAFAPQQQEMGAAEAEGIAPGAGDLAPGESDIVDAAAMEPDSEDEEIRLVDEFGEWRVATCDGRHLIGWVFPGLMQFQPSMGEDLVPMSLFTNGSEFSVQPGVAGIRVGKGGNLPHGPVRGHGFLYCVEGGNAKATVPFQVQLDQQQGGMQAYQAITDIGEFVRFSFAPNIQKIQFLGDGLFAVPDHYRFCPLEGQMTKLVDAPEGFNKESEARGVAQVGTLMCHGPEYSLKGRAFHKLAQQDYQFVDRAGAEFLMVCAGVHPRVAKEKLAESVEVGHAELGGLRPIVPLSEVREEAVKTAAERIKDLPKAVLLVKEAGDLADGDADTVDAVLSLGFLSPETMSVFVSYMPYLEDSVNRLADLLLAVRIGQKIINESSVRTALFSLESVVNGLKLLSHA